ncbi:MAG: sulfatase-like hydrolase/transferase, partial [Verrucomicrobiia bacterium]
MRIHIWMLAVCLMLAGALKATDRPNILWLSAEDISPHLGCYGDANAITPHLDKLATEGTRYTHAFTTAGVCAPCRSGIITGMYQTTLGTHHMRCKA